MGAKATSPSSIRIRQTSIRRLPQWIRSAALNDHGGSGDAQCVPLPAGARAGPGTFRGCAAASACIRTRARAAGSDHRRMVCCNQTVGAAQHGVCAQLWLRLEGLRPILDPRRSPSPGEDVDIHRLRIAGWALNASGSGQQDSARVVNGAPFSFRN